MRSTSDPIESRLALVFKEAMRISDQMKAEGASKEDREAYVANVLKDAWPKGRAQPWVYYCDACSDTGWAIRECVQGSCGRPFKLPKQAADDHTGRGQCGNGHTYAVPCVCNKGQDQRRALLKERRDEDAMDVAARVTKPTRVGR